jgi:hypothetical protein
VHDLDLEPAGSFEGVLEEGERLVCFGIGLDGGALALAVPAADADAPFVHDDEPHATFPRPRADRPYTASVLHVNAARAERFPLEHVTATFPRIQLLPDGEILVVGTRSGFHADGSYDLNATVFGPDGGRRREFLLGDGIQDVQATPRGQIWVSYFDEGVFGNFGWGQEWSRPPVGAAGLIRWTSEGGVTWTYAPPPGAGRIVDCYALNVADDAAWAYYYDGFPLVRVDQDGSRTAWRTPVAGAHAFALGDGCALFHGGYRDEKDRCVLVDFDEGTLVERVRIRLLLPSGVPAVGRPVIGRGRYLHVFDGPRWLRTGADAASRAV